MDFFTKNKVLFWCVIILIMLNVVTLASFWLRKPPVGPHAGPERKPTGQQLMEQRLDLSPEAADRIERLRNEHFARTRPLQEDMHRIRLDILDEIFSDTPDPDIIDAMLAELDKRQSLFEENLFTHFQELKGVCDPRQAQELKSMLRALIEQTRPREPGQPRPGPGPEGGPGHRPLPER